MPSMYLSDFGKSIPKNADEILQAVNNLILYHEECVFWEARPEDTDAWARDIIRRCAADDRSGELSSVPHPIF